MAQAMAVTPRLHGVLGDVRRAALLEGAAGGRARQWDAAPHPPAVPQRVGTLDLVHVDGVVAVQHDEVGGLLGRVAQARQVRPGDKAQPVHPADPRGQPHQLQPQCIGAVRLGAQQIALDEVRQDARHGGPRHARAAGDLVRRQPAGRRGERAQHGEAVGEQGRVGAELERRRAERPGALVRPVGDEPSGLEQVEEAVGARPGDVAGRGDDAGRRGARAAREELEHVQDPGRAPGGAFVVVASPAWHVVDLPESSIAATFTHDKRKRVQRAGQAGPALDALGAWRQGWATTHPNAPGRIRSCPSLTLTSRPAPAA